MRFPKKSSTNRGGKLGWDLLIPKSSDESKIYLFYECPSSSDAFWGVDLSPKGTT